MPSGCNLGGRAAVIIFFRYPIHRRSRLEFSCKYLLQGGIEIRTTSPRSENIPRSSAEYPPWCRTWNAVAEIAGGFVFPRFAILFRSRRRTRVPLATCSQILSMGTYGNKVQAAKSAWGGAGTQWWAPRISHRGTRPLPYLFVHARARVHLSLLPRYVARHLRTALSRALKFLPKRILQKRE